MNIPTRYKILFDGEEAFEYTTQLTQQEIRYVCTTFKKRLKEIDSRMVNKEYVVTYRFTSDTNVNVC